MLCYLASVLILIFSLFVTPLEIGVGMMIAAGLFTIAGAISSNR